MFYQETEALKPSQFKRLTGSIWFNA